MKYEVNAFVGRLINSFSRFGLATSLAASLVGVSLFGVGCTEVLEDPPISFQLKIPSQDMVQFGTELTKRYGIGLTGSFPIQQYGSIFLEAETPSNNFRFGFNLNTRAFLKENWLNFQEVNSLPTGGSFPAWLSGPVIDYQNPQLDSKDFQWHFYLGTRGQQYVGVAAVLKAVNNQFPAVNVGYSFYDKSGNVVLGLLFFGPKLDGNGKVVVPGGIFVGTNITPLLPKAIQGGAQVVASSPVGELQDLNLEELAHKATDGQSVNINGRSAVAYVDIRGRDASDFDNAKKVKKLISRYTAASRK